MLTNRDLIEIQELEDQCISLAQRMATGKHDYHVSLNELITSLIYETKARLNKKQITHIVHQIHV